MGYTRGLLVGVLPALLGVGVGHEPRVAVDADGLVRGRGRRPRAPAALLGPAPRHLGLLVDEVVGAPEEARPVLGAARIARNVELDEVLVQMRPAEVAALVHAEEERERREHADLVRRADPKKRDWADYEEDEDLPTFPSRQSYTVVTPAAKKPAWASIVANKS